MAEKVWQTIKVEYCDRRKTSVELEVQMVYPAEHLPDCGPRIVGHRCSYGAECSLLDKPACVWAGTNPAYDPFQK